MNIGLFGHFMAINPFLYLFCAEDQSTGLFLYRQSGLSLRRLYQLPQI